MCDTARQATDDNITQCRTYAICMPDNSKNTDKNSQYLIIFMVNSHTKYLWLNNSAKGTHCCIYMATVNTFI